MNVSIEIHYRAGSSRSTQKASYPLKGRTAAQIALAWWKEIKKEMSYHAELEKIIVDGNQDIKQLVNDLEEQELNKSLNDNLPF